MKLKHLVIWEMFMADKGKWAFKEDEEMQPLTWLYYSRVYDKLQKC